jgi:hypothetical protein
VSADDTDDANTILVGKDLVKNTDDVAEPNSGDDIDDDDIDPFDDEAVADPASIPEDVGDAGEPEAPDQNVTGAPTP